MHEQLIVLSVLYLTMTKAEYINKYGIEQYKEHLISCNIRNKDRYKNDKTYRDIKLEHDKTNHKERYNNDLKFRTCYREYQKEYQKEYKLIDLNSNGLTKDSIRQQSLRILFKQRHHTKFKGYQIHHAFGYSNPSKFVYIPKSLHVKIHQYLRDNNIDADTDHYKYISTMINECEEYTYISV